MERDAWFFVGVFVFIFLVWIATGGPTHPISFTGPTLAQPQELGGGTYLQLPRAPFMIGGEMVSLPGSSSGYIGSTGSETPVPAPIYGIPFGVPSPYRNMISMSTSVANASTTREYIQFTVVQSASQSVDITGWVLHSDATGHEEIIPKGTRVPTSGIVNAADDITLSPGDRAMIFTGPSPVGASFRENKCTGYFNSFQDFQPTLPQNCPDPSDELERLYGKPYIHDPSCIDFVNTLSRCEVPISEPSHLSLTCQEFVETQLNYNGCLRSHQGDSDFNGTTWRIYLDRTDKKGNTIPMWRSQHDIVKLLDERGKTVATFTY